MMKEKLLDGFLFSTAKERLDIPYIHHYLSTQSYWATDIPLEIVERSIAHSLCFGIYEHDKQIGFARVITDQATFAYLADVFVDENYRGIGLSKKLMEFILSVDEAKVFRRWLLGTRDAHTLYEQFGFKPLAQPDRFMEIHRKDIYKLSTSS